MIYRERTIEQIAADLDTLLPPHTFDLASVPLATLINYEESGQIMFEETRLLTSNKNVTDKNGVRLGDLEFWRWRHRLLTLIADLKMRLTHVRAEMARRGHKSNLVRSA